MRSGRKVFAIYILASLLAAGIWGQGRRNPPVAITNVTVIPMDRERTVPNATVVVHEGKIVSVAPGGEVPEGAVVIDGKGKFLIPGLADMHAHLFSDYEFPEELAEDELRVMVANGVTTVRLMIGTREHIGLRERVRNGQIFGPNVYAASPQISGRAFGEIFNGYVATDAEQAREAVRKAKADGFDFIKLTFFISRPVFDAVVDEAKKHRIPVIGHVDRQVGLEASLDAGQQVEHLDGYFEAMLPEGSEFPGSTSGVFVWRPEAWQSLDVLDESKIPELARLTVEKSPYTVPTLTFLKKAFGSGQTDEEITARVDHGFLPDKIREEMGGPRAQFWKSPPSEERRAKYVGYRNKLVKAIHDAGGKVMAGSDAPEWFLLYGYTLHRELESLSEAGLSNYAVLESATKNPAEFLGDIGETGTIEKGKRADLVLLDANPLDDISNTQKIAGVMLRGRWMGKESIDRMLSDIRPRFRAAFEDRPKLISEDPSLNGSAFRGTVSPDGNSLYFFKKMDPREEDYRIFRTDRRDGKWSPAVRVDLGGEHSDLYPSISNDGRRMVFASYRKVPGDTSEKPNAHIWIAERKGDGWGEPRLVEGVNRLGWYHSWVELGPDGSIHFRRTSPDWSQTETLVARPDGEGFKAPVPYEEVTRWQGWREDVDVEGGTPGPSEDLVFLNVRSRDPATGRLSTDIWLTRYLEGRWTEPKPLGPTINLGGIDLFQFFSKDGKTMYFVRDFARIYSVPMDDVLESRE